MTSHRLWFGALVAVLAACGSPNDAKSGATSDTARAALQVALGDSVAWENDLTSGALYHVVVTTRADTDTVPDVLTTQLPVVVGDSILGIRYEEDRVLGAFEYAPATRTLRNVALPSDAFQFATPHFAPDGRHLAYLALDSTGRASGVVIAWPSLGVLYRGAPATPLATDATVDELSWPDAAHFTLAVTMQVPLRATQRARGTIGYDGRATVVVDTLPPDPPNAP